MKIHDRVKKHLGSNPHNRRFDFYRAGYLLYLANRIVNNAVGIIEKEGSYLLSDYKLMIHRETNDVLYKENKYTIFDIAREKLNERYDSNSTHWHLSDD